jgi:hypothetical protein
MDEPRVAPRQRCVKCRRRFRPHPAAKGNQRTCSARCRLERKGELAKRRRSVDLEHFRQLERARQRKHRGVAQEERGARAQRVTGAMSRAGLFAEVPQMVQLALGIWDELAQVSRARLESELTRHVGVSGPNLAGA